MLITQTGGGCRASNYIYLLKKALKRAGYENVPVASLNFAGLGGGLKLSLAFIRKAFASILYGDLLMALYNQVKPYEAAEGDADRLKEAWIGRIAAMFAAGKGYTRRSERKTYEEIVSSFAAVPTAGAAKTKVGIVGEIYVKYSPFGNNNLEAFLLENGCEPNVPGLLGFLQYSLANAPLERAIYGGRFLKSAALSALLGYTKKCEADMNEAIAAHGFRRPVGYEEVKSAAEGLIGLGAVMGEGWLLTGEMAALVEAGCPNIVCAQPFGCLPNHVVGKAMISKIQEKLPSANITAIDYDASQSRVNQENRIRLMLASCERNKPARAPFESFAPKAGYEAQKPEAVPAAALSALADGRATGTSPQRAVK